jgi:DNA modification methylase
MAREAIAVLAPLNSQLYFWGELVLDPFAGSGRTCAASLCDRHYLGIEPDPAYFEQAVNRMARIRGGLSNDSLPFHIQASVGYRSPTDLNRLSYLGKPA